MKKVDSDLFGICPFVTSQKVLQGKWAILVLHELSEGTKRFNELERAIKITHASLSSQLKYLEREGIVSRTVYPEVPPRVEYSLTAIGRQFRPVLASIEAWGNSYIEYLHANR
ncbi:helix-turn-helix domain-containing protein [uncultured Mitsuokella sp.]|uniref:winged helix-turn-helix transcriptional regulator n=1 Tax=uncultured Mitsuokella sp. TaxID=453120 RepID=UPI0026DD0E0A|nr:helix-turn-helix domain-containing protein [uncultured Mitsuokella sp.]